MKNDDARSAAERLLRGGVRCEALGREESQTLLERFVSEFVDPKKQESTLMRLRRAAVRQKPVEYHELLRPERTTDMTDAKEHFVWLSKGGRFPACYLFSRTTYRGALRIEIATLNEAMATSWPGLFVNFDAGRALAVTLDLERFRSDLGQVRGARKP